MPTQKRTGTPRPIGVQHGKASPPFRPSRFGRTGRHLRLFPLGGKLSRNCLQQSGQSRPRPLRARRFIIVHLVRCLSGPMTALLPSGVTDKYWSECHGPYERSAPGGDGASSPELSDAPCYPKGDTHGRLATAPDTVTGCTDSYTQNGDLDFDGTPYWAEWPTGTTPTAQHPSSFVESLPTTAGQQYPQFLFQTDLALSESAVRGRRRPRCCPPDARASSIRTGAAKTRTVHARWSSETSRKAAPSGRTPNTGPTRSRPSVIPSSRARSGLTPASEH